MTAMFQAFALAASLLVVHSHGLLGWVKNFPRQENSFITYRGYLVIFTPSRDSKSVDRKLAGNILATELVDKKNDELIGLSLSSAAHAYRRDIFSFSLIRSPPVTSPS